MTREKKIKCEICKKEIPQSVARTEEGKDYIHHFCSDSCQKHYFTEHPEKKQVCKKSGDDD